jgi:hypothetical protein
MNATQTESNPYAKTKKQAKAGGERGANGEWYEGGQFICTVPDYVGRRKQERRQMREVPEWVRQRDARELRVIAWLRDRTTKLENLKEELAISNSQFFQNMAREISAYCRLSPKQAAIVAKNFPGFSAEYLSEEFPG